MSNSRLGTLGFHLDERPCRVACPFCYLGERSTARRPRSADELTPEQAAAIVAGAAARDIAVAVSEPATRWRAGLLALVAAARARGLPVAVTTTPDVVARDPWVLDGCARLSLSIDPHKASFARAAAVLGEARAARPELEVVALVSVVSPAFADELAAGALAALLASPAVDIVALNALKPPPAWSDRAFWLGFMKRIRPLLDAELHRRLHLDCAVSARILKLGGCPAKPDVTGHEFRACVYQREPTFVFADPDELARRTEDYQAPTACPFEIV